MRFIFRLLSLLCLVVAVISGTIDAIRSVSASQMALTPLGQAWFDISPGTLNLTQAMVQRYLWPYLWDPMIQWVLLQPTFAVFLVLSLLFYLIGHKRRTRAGDRYLAR